MDLTPLYIIVALLMLLALIVLFFGLRSRRAERRAKAARQINPQAFISNGVGGRKHGYPRSKPQ
jgi:uncharacterized membrane protein YfcA